MGLTRLPAPEPDPEVDGPRLVLLDDHGKETTEGDHVRFTYGIPPVYVCGPVIRRGKSLIVLTPGHKPDECNLRSLRSYVGVWYKENDQAAARQTIT